MKTAYTKSALDALENAPANVRRAFYKQVRLLEGSLTHPGLRAKKYDEANDVWQARVNRDWRFYFTIEGDTHIIHKVIPHPK